MLTQNLTMYFTQFYYVKSSTDLIHDSISLSHFQLLDNRFLHFPSICVVVSDTRRSMFSHEIFFTLSNQPCFAEIKISFHFYDQDCQHFHSLVCCILFCQHLSQHLGKNYFHQHFTPADQHFTPADTSVSLRLRIS